MLSSYQYHIVNLSLFLGGISKLGPSLLESSTLSEWMVRGGGLLVLIALLYNELWYIWQRRNMPCGTSGMLWLLGDSPFLFWNPPRFFKRQLEYGSDGAFTFNMLTRPVATFTTDEQVAWLSSQERKGKTKPYFPANLQDLLGTKSILLSHGAFHKRLRRLMEPAFLPNATKSYLPLMDRLMQGMIDEWAQDCQDPQHWLSLRDCKKFSLKVLFHCAFPQIDRSIMDKLLYDAHIVVDSMETIFPFQFPGTKLEQGFQAKTRLMETLSGIVDVFKAKHTADSDEGQNSLLGRLCYSQDEDGQTLTHDELLQNLFIIVLAGFDTFAGTMGSILYHLKTSIQKSPKLQSALEEESMSLASKGNGQDETCYDSWKEAPLLNAFLAEVWRIDPPVSHHIVSVTDDLVYKDQYVIPKGALVGFTIQDSVFNEKRYKDPSEYRVERFLPPDHPLMGGEDAASYCLNVDYNIPGPKNRTFSVGPHMCLGHHFARWEARLFIVRLLETYELDIRNPKLVLLPLRRWTPEFRVWKRRS